MQGRVVCFNKSEKGNQNKPRNSDRSSKISSLTGILGELTWEWWCDMHRNGGEALWSPQPSSKHGVGWESNALTPAKAVMSWGRTCSTPMQELLQPGGNGHCWHRAGAKRRSTRSQRGGRGSVGEKQAWRRWAGCRREVLLWENKVLHLQHILVCAVSSPGFWTKRKQPDLSIKSEFPSINCLVPHTAIQALLGVCSVPLVSPSCCLGFRRGCPALLMRWCQFHLHRALVWAEFPHPASDQPAPRHSWAQSTGQAWGILKAKAWLDQTLLHFNPGCLQISQSKVQPTRQSWPGTHGAVPEQRAGCWCNI